MKTLTLTAENHVIDKILQIINEFSKEDITSITTQDEMPPIPPIKSMKDLGGILSSYTDGYISDAKMHEAITQGMCDRAMIK
ncbi:MAG: hypothetical protein Q4C68_00775 [Moraxella sp.]|nr:hypothetical protein [Moraxella sp.]